eukprot:c10854_g1_i1 orf=3-566(-)
MTLVERGSLVLSCDRHLDDPAQPSSQKKKTRHNEQNLETSGNPLTDTESLELQWRDYFRNASQWLDNANTKTYPSTPNFKHTSTSKEYSSFWAQEKQRRRRVHAAEGEDGVEKRTRMAKRTLFKGQQEEGLDIKEFWYDTATLVALLKDCAKQKDLQRGSDLHAGIVTRGLLGKNVLVSNNLVSMYAK